MWGLFFVFLFLLFLLIWLLSCLWTIEFLKNENAILRNELDYYIDTNLTKTFKE